MKDRFIKYYMDIAKRTSELSYAERLKVGAIIVKDDRIISIGFNGTPSGWTNECEDTFADGHATWSKTKPEVIHAEANAIAKLAKSPESGVGSMLFLTHSPCMQCAKQIYTAGIEEVIYKEEYRDCSGVEFLRKCGIKVTKYE